LTDLLRALISAYLVATLTATSLAKLGQRHMVTVIAQRGRVIPVKAASTIVVATAAAELALGTSMMVGFEPDATDVATAALFVVFAAYRLALAGKTKSLMCGCAGTARSDPAHPPIVIATTLACLFQAGLAATLVGWHATGMLEWLAPAAWVATFLVAVGGSMKTIARRRRMHELPR
jgi:hypothetical protein